MKRKMTMLLTLSLSLLIAGAALAQPRGPRGEMSPERIEKFKEKRGKLLRKKVGLEETEAVQIEAVMDKFQVERKELRSQVREAKQALKALLDEDSGDQLAYQNNLDILLATRAAMQELHSAEIAELRGLLTPKKATKLLAMMERVHKRMRGMKHGKKRGMKGRCEGGDCPMKGEGRGGFGPGPGGGDGFGGPGGFSF